MARELRGPMRGLLVLEAVKYRRSDSYLTGLGGYFANVARSGLPMLRVVESEIFILLQFTTFNPRGNATNCRTKKHTRNDATNE